MLRFFLASAVFLLPVLSHASTLSSYEQGQRIVALHLLKLIGTPELSALVKSKQIRSADYWAGVFKKNGAAPAFDAIRAPLERAMTDVPLVQGRPASPDEFATIVLKGLSPMPLIPLSELSAADKRRVVDFTVKAFQPFSEKAYASAGDLETASAGLSMEAGRIFQSGFIAEAFHSLASRTAGLEAVEQQVELNDATSRLNEALHLWGVHLVLGAEALNAGRVNLSAHLIDQKYAYTVLGTTFAVYEVKPLVENEYYPALGHAEPEEGFLFLFGQTIEQNIDDFTRFINDPNVEFLRAGAECPVAYVQAIDILVRDALTDADGNPVGRPALRTHVIDTVGHHEGFHKHFEPLLSKAVSQWELSMDESSVVTEMGAYLYQLESADERYILADLLLIAATALNPDTPYYGNKQGAREALLRLVEAPLSDNLLQLFKMPGAQIKTAAAKARQDFEIKARNGQWR